MPNGRQETSQSAKGREVPNVAKSAKGDTLASAGTDRDDW
jgi:hypothetical protein